MMAQFLLILIDINVIGFRTIAVHIRSTNILYALLDISLFLNIDAFVLLPSHQKNVNSEDSET